MKKYLFKIGCFAVNHPESIAFLVSITCSLISIAIGLKEFWQGYINAATFYLTYILFKKIK